MEVCHEWRCSHAEFLQWSKDSRDKAIWWLARKRAACGNCGTRPEEFDEARGGHQAYAWDVDHCRGCELRAQGEEHLANANKSTSPYPRGTFIILRRNEEID